MKKLILLLVCCFVGFGAYADENPNDPGHICTETFCWEYPHGGDVNTYCEDNDLSVGDYCAATGASWAECISNKNRAGDVVKSCAAKECSDGWALWLTKRGGKWESQGLCRSIEWLQQQCDTGCSHCNPDEECVVNLKQNSDRNRAAGYYGDAFWDTEACHCVKKELPPVAQSCETKYAGKPDRIACCKLEEQNLAEWIGDDDTGYCKCTDDNKEFKNGECIEKGKTTPQENCEYFFNGFVQCGSVKILVKKRYPISEEMVEKLGLGDCTDVQNIIDKDKAKLKELEKKFCADPNRNNYGDLIDEDREYQEARERLDAFMRNAELNVSVWKNSEGKFNTSRLASDLTACVVLGTVGGIVSANIIKKKQVEKGFDALNCTIGGQKVADWGDEFTVGLRRY